MNEDSQFEIEFLECVYEKDHNDRAVMELLAGLYTRAGRIDEGLHIDQRLTEINPDNPLAHYNLACSLSLKSKTREAIASLRKALELGYSDFKWMLKDPDLYHLHPSPLFAALLAEFQINQHITE